MRLEGRAFGDVPLNLEYKLEVWDSPNSAGIIIDAVRAAKIAKDRGIGGPVFPASAYLMKSPPVQMPDDKARAELETFIDRLIRVPGLPAECAPLPPLLGFCDSRCALGVSGERHEDFD